MVLEMAGLRSRGSVGVVAVSMRWGGRTRCPLAHRLPPGNALGFGSLAVSQYPMNSPTQVWASVSTQGGPWRTTSFVVAGICSIGLAGQSKGNVSLRHIGRWKRSYVPFRLFSFQFGLVQQSAAQSVTWPARQWVHSRRRTIPEMANYYLLLFSFFKRFWNAALTFKKKYKKNRQKKKTPTHFFSTISTMTQKFTRKWGRWSVLTETDRNQSKTIEFWIE